MQEHFNIALAKGNATTAPNRQISLRGWKRVTKGNLIGLPHFAAEEKRGDPRYQWFVRHYGQRCFELDALDPNELRDRVEHVIRSQINFEAWNRCKAVEKAEHQSLVEIMESWGRRP